MGLLRARALLIGIKNLVQGYIEKFKEGKGKLSPKSGVKGIKIPGNVLVCTDV